MSEIILDTSFLVGLIDEGDIWHKKAYDAFISLIAKENKISYIASFDEDFDMVEGLVRIKDKESVKL